jgi:CRP-like cAMP-binding protein
MLLEKIVIQSKTTIREKILAYLSLLAEQQDSRYVTLPITKTAMAGFLSVNRSAMMRELSNMKKEGIIDYQKDTFRILVASAT